MGPAQLADVLRHIPISADPNLLVGFETRDDAGVYLLSPDMALVQTVDFFTPIVDDPYAYGQIAAANAMSDVYAMGGKPLTVLNIACFDPKVIPPETWAAVLRGAHDKVTEAGAVVVGGHSVEDETPKFGLAVTGLVDPKKMFTNAAAEPGEAIYLSKPLGAGILTTAAKWDQCRDEELRAGIESMSRLNREAAELGMRHGIRCATDITGFGLAGHLYNVAQASGVRIEIDSKSLPLLPGIQRLAEEGNTTGGAKKNEEFVGSSLVFDESVPAWLRDVILDPQTSGGLALFSKVDLPGLAKIGKVVAGPPGLRIR
ncbi:MAG TPA: selenide, water dikinase SelD [Fimbriimonadaceae bacterium]|nr:selenide, water dikinase SelD [Fimbriimonadaceae bacterium]